MHPGGNLIYFNLFIVIIRLLTRLASRKQTFLIQKTVTFDSFFQYAIDWNRSRQTVMYLDWVWSCIRITRFIFDHPYSRFKTHLSSTHHRFCQEHCMLTLVAVLTMPKQPWSASVITIWYASCTSKTHWLEWLRAYAAASASLRHWKSFTGCQSNDESNLRLPHVIQA